MLEPRLSFRRAPWGGVPLTSGSGWHSYDILAAWPALALGFRLTFRVWQDILVHPGSFCPPSPSSHTGLGSANSVRLGIFTQAWYICSPGSCPRFHSTLPASPCTTSFWTGPGVGFVVVLSRPLTLGHSHMISWPCTAPLSLASLPRSWPQLSPLQTQGTEMPGLDSSSLVARINQENQESM